ncbi:MAG: FHA domain-containing protein [Desulfobacteraceae bacterium]|nr:FHA domain-containing protein [Desulfobacteraceae bacterium]MBC2756559.1 FHA domain-containing protein [Desulfobacteraceae bacterium]
MHNDQVLKIELAIKDNVLKTYSFTQDIVEIGRIPTADIFIDNTGISRQHTRIERSIGGPYIVKDMGSTNGTFVNDLQINEAALKNNDVINLSKFSLRVTIEAGDQSKNNSSGVSPDDFDGTTVLSAEQLAQLRAGIENNQPSDSGRKPPGASAQSGSSSEDSGLSLSQLILWGGVILAVIVIGFFIFK